MSWRTVQLGTAPCDQDQLIMDLFHNQPVNYVGPDTEFQQMLMHDASASSVAMVINHPVWVSDIVMHCEKHLTNSVKTFYLGVNRYCVLGNNTNLNINAAGNHSDNLISLLSEIATRQGFTVTQSGQHDQDLGRYFNFVQPMVLVYLK